MKKIIEKVINWILQKLVTKYINKMNSSMKTNWAAILLALGAVLTAVAGCLSDAGCDFNSIALSVSQLIAAFGFLKARDHDVSSESAGAK